MNDWSPLMEEGDLRIDFTKDKMIQLSAASMCQDPIDDGVHSFIVI
jgi:hypothetical protein